MMEATVEIEEVSLASIRTSTNILIQGPPGAGRPASRRRAKPVRLLSTEIEGAISAAVSGLTPALARSVTEYCVAGVARRPKRS